MLKLNGWTVKSYRTAVLQSEEEEEYEGSKEEKKRMNK